MRGVSGLGSGDGFQRLHVASDLGGNLVLGDFQVVAGLEIHPEYRSVLEIARKAQSRVGGDATPLVHDVRDASLLVPLLGKGGDRLPIIGPVLSQPRRGAGRRCQTVLFVFSPGWAGLFFGGGVWGTPTAMPAW